MSTHIILWIAWIAHKINFQFARFLSSMCHYHSVSCVFLAFIVPMLSDCAVYLSRSMDIMYSKVALRAFDDTVLVGKMSDV